MLSLYSVNTLRSRQNRRHVASAFSLKKMFWIPIKISSTFVPKGPINTISVIGSNNIFAPCRRQAIIWTNVYQRIYASLGLNELKALIFLRWNRNHSIVRSPCNVGLWSRNQGQVSMKIPIFFRCRDFIFNKANLKDLIALTSLVILLKLGSNRRFFIPCDLEILWMTSKIIGHEAFCPISNLLVNSNLSYSPETLNSGQNRRFFVWCDLENWWMT